MKLLHQKLAIAATFSLATIANLSGLSPTWAKEITWRYQTSVVKSRQEMEPIRQWAERIKKNSDGRLNIEIYYGGALGIDQSDELRAIRQGAVEVASPYPGYHARDLPEISVAIVQGVLLDPDEAVGVTDTLKEIYRESYEAWNAKVIGWSMSPLFDMSILCKESVGTLAELKGKKLRVWSRAQVDAFTKIGVPAQIIPQNDAYVALQIGVVDCAIYVVGNAKSVSYQEVTNYAAQLHTYSATPGPVVVNRDVWEILPDDLKKIVLEAGKWLWESTLKTALSVPLAKEQDAIKEFSASGDLNILPPFPAADKKIFYDAVLEVWEARAEKAGGKAPEYRQQVIDALAKLRDQ